MPTTLARTNITHTPRVQRLLDIAKTQWPEERPSVQMINLMETGATKITETDEDAEFKARLAELDRRAAEFHAKYQLTFPDNYLNDLRSEWDREWDQ